MFKNHLKALSEKDSQFELVHLDERIWLSDELLKSFDVAWGYVRFHPIILQRLRQLKIPVIGGPNIVMESAHDGITDEYESRYLTGDSVDMNLNVAEYYRDHVQKFVKNGMKCRVLEGCYDFEEFEFENSLERETDVLLYHKVRTNDSSDRAERRLVSIDTALKSKGFSTEIMRYGSHERQQYFEACKRSKVVAWLSIEDYASIAQIEAHLCGACVVGTPFNLTIPVLNEAICKNSQTMSNWISWNDVQEVTDDYVKTIENVLKIENLQEKTRHKAVERHSFSTYRNNLEKVLKELL